MSDRFQGIEIAQRVTLHADREAAVRIIRSQDMGQVKGKRPDGSHAGGGTKMSSCNRFFHGRVTQKADGIPPRLNGGAFLLWITEEVDSSNPPSPGGKITSVA
jgi:hypothetical protein